MNLTAYDNQDKALFVRQCKNKQEARREIINNPLLVRVEKVVFKNREYKIGEVYRKWPITTHKPIKREVIYD